MQPVADQPLQRPRHRERSRRVERLLDRGERPRQLQREEGVAAGDLVQPQQGGTRERAAELHPEEALQSRRG